MTEAFAQYTAYAFDGFLAVGRMLSEAVYQMNVSGQIDRINHFSYEDQALADVFNAILENSSFPFEGLTVSVYPQRVRFCGTVKRLTMLG